MKKILLMGITSPKECPYHHPDVPYCSKAKITCYNDFIPKECPLNAEAENE